MEKGKLYEFVGTCVLHNITLPPTIAGGRPVTVQELIHNRSVESLERYADMLERESPRVSRTQKRKGEPERMVHPQLSFKQLVEAVDLIIEYVVEQEEQQAREQQKTDLLAKLEKFKTRDQKRQDVINELKRLGVEIPEEPTVVTTDVAPPTQST